MLALRSFRDKHKGLDDLLGYAMLIDDGVILMKDGSLLAGFNYTGPDTQGVSDDEQNSLAEAINKALARLGSGWAIWSEACRIPVTSYPPPELCRFSDPISQLVDAERRAHYTAPDTHFTTTHALILQYTPPSRRKSRLQDLVYTDTAETKVSPANRTLAHFKRTRDNLLNQLSAALEIRRMVSYKTTDANGAEHFRDELVSFLHFELTGHAVEINLPPLGCYLDIVLGRAPLWPGDPPRFGDDFLACVTVDAFPDASFPGMLDALNGLAIPYRWSTRFIFTDTHEARHLLDQYRKRWQQVVRGWMTQLFQRSDGGKFDQDAQLMVNQADNSLAEANSGLVTFGYFTLNIVLRDTDREALAEKAKLVIREIQRSGFDARLETINVLEAWLGSLAGHVLPNVRRPFLHTDHLAHLLPLSSPWIGRDTNPCPFYSPNSPALLYGSTDGATPIRINLHVDDVGHTLIFGPTGAGKTVLLSTVAMQALRYPGASVWSFDYKRGMVATVTACGGDHYDLMGDDAPSFCPLGILEDDADMAWAEDWIATCYYLSSGKQATDTQQTAIHRTMTLLRADNTPGSRSLTHFVMLVQDQAIRDALQYYTNNGTMGRMLDAEADNIAYGRLMAFEMEDLLALPQKAALPALLYLFRRFERSLDGSPTFLLLDEAWALLANPIVQPKIVTWLRTMRSKNCAVIMATQQISDAHRSGILDVLLDNCPTKIFLPNEGAETAGSEKSMGSRDYYAAMGLGPEQISLIRHSTKKRDYYLVQSGPDGGSRLLTLDLGPIALAFSSATSKPDLARIRALAQEHQADWPFAWLKEKGVQYEHLVDDENVFSVPQDVA